MSSWCMAEFLVGFRLVQKYYNFAIILHPLVWLATAYLVVLGKEDQKKSSHLDLLIPTCIVACSNFLLK